MSQFQRSHTFSKGKFSVTHTSPGHSPGNRFTDTLRRSFVFHHWASSQLQDKRLQAFWKFPQTGCCLCWLEIDLKVIPKEIAQRSLFKLHPPKEGWEKLHLNRYYCKIRAQTHQSPTQWGTMVFFLKARNNTHISVSCVLSNTISRQSHPDSFHSSLSVLSSCQIPSCLDHSLLPYWPAQGTDFDWFLRFTFTNN